MSANLADTLKQKFLALPLLKQGWLAALSFFVAIFIFTAFFGGGDAWHGHEAGGRYFMAHHHGAPEHEVSAALFYVNLWVLRLLACMWVIGIGLGIRETLAKWRRTNSN